jgi:hypothetical protein
MFLLHKRIAPVLFGFIISVFCLYTFVVSTTIAQSCPSGTSCVGNQIWDRPVGCDPVCSKSETGTIYCYYNQTYSRITNICNSSCAWTSWGNVCDTVTGIITSQVFNGSCCTAPSGGGGSCEWSCVAHSSESQTCAQDACYLACTSSHILQINKL